MKRLLTTFALMAAVSFGDTAGHGYFWDDSNLLPHFPVTEREFTAADYVQDGLVAMWDGVENVGWGVHDAYATSWVDLVNGVETTAGQFGMMHFSANALVVTKGGEPGLVIPEETGNRLNSVNYTIECVVAPQQSGKSFHGNRGNGKGTLYDVGLDGGGKLYFTAYYGFDLFTSRVFELGTVHTVSVTSSSRGGNLTLLYDNAVVVSSKTSVYNPQGGRWGICGSWNTFGALGEYFQFRIYSRALTEEEIAWNYEVDRARFGF